MKLGTTDSSIFTFLGVTTAALCQLSSVSGHGYMYEPSTRNYFAHTDGLDWGQQAGLPKREYCHHCLNRNSRVCGISEGGANYDEWIDSFNNPMPWISQGTYVAGETITVKVHLATNHAGHMELRGCPLGPNSDQDCFDQFPFEFESDSDGMPKDTTFTGRGYFYGGVQANGRNYEMTFRVPDTLYGSEVLLQWYYVTANSCTPPGYAEYFSGESNSEGRELSGSFWNAELSTCIPPYPLVPGAPSSSTPELFVNCAEVKILPMADGTPPAPGPSPPPSTMGPVPSPTRPPVPPPPPGLPQLPQLPSPTFGPAPIITPPPTPSPTVGPAPTPTVPTVGPAPTPTAPQVDSPSACCSQDFRVCATWCTESQDVCESCPGGTPMVWLPLGPVDPADTCIARWGSCTHNTLGCCPGMLCRGDQWYMQCQHPDEAPPSTEVGNR